MMKLKEWAGTAMLAVVAMGLVAGCESTGVKRTDKLATSLDDARRNLQTANVAVSNTLVTLALLQQEDTVLADTYPALKKQVSEVSSSVARIKQGSLAVQQAGKAKFDAWKLELETIQDENLKKQSLKRMETSLKAHEELIKLLNETETTLDPFVANLSDIVKYLDLDLSKDGIKSISGEMKKAGKSGEKVQDWIAGVVAGLASK